MRRIGITQRVETVESYDETRDCLDQQWARLVRKAGFAPLPLPNRVDDPKPYLADLGIDGIVFTGGNDFADLSDSTDPAPERDRFEHAALEYAIETDLSVFGVCRGLQLIHRYFGGTIERIEGHVATSHPVSIDTEQAPVDVDEVEANSFHRYGFGPGSVGDELRVRGVAPDGSVEWLAHETLPIEGVMWHPERSGAPEILDDYIFTDCFGGGF